MKKYLLTVVFCMMYLPFCFSSNTDRILSDLKAAMKQKNDYSILKEKKIQDIKDSYKIMNLSPRQKYVLNDKLYDEYKKYKVDSAIVYVEKNMLIAYGLKDKLLIADSKLKLSGLYSTAGLYIESINIINSIHSKDLSKKLLPEYYETCGDFFNHYAQSNNRYRYFNEKNLYQNFLMRNLNLSIFQKSFYSQYMKSSHKYAGYSEGNLYTDSLLNSLNKNSLEYKIVLSEREIYLTGKFDDAESRLLTLYRKTKDTEMNYALITYLLGTIYRLKNNVDLQKVFFAKSAIADIKCANKDNASMQSLALLLSEDNKNIRFAYECIQSAMEDAVFCGVRYRAIEGSFFYPIITANFQMYEKKHKEELLIYLAVISVLSVFLIFSIGYIYKQLKHLAKTRKALKVSNLQLTSLNNDLSRVNKDLSESDKIKEKYIAYSFDLYSNYINKLEAIQNKVNKTIKLGEKEDIVCLTSPGGLADIDHELKEFYKNFDRIFVEIYPDFVNKFNNLLLEDQKIALKPDEVLNTELRIFALIRMGVSDSNKISKYLHCSLSTIYNYRTKMRNRAAVPREDFEKYVMRIE